MVHFPAAIVLACSVLAFASPLGKRTVAQIEADLTTINTDVTTLDNGINGFPNSGGSLTQALAIHTAATTLASALTKATTDTKGTPGPLSEADGTTILNSVSTIQPKIIDALNVIIGKRAAFDALPLGGVSSLVKSDLATLNSDTSAFEDALIAIAPSDLVPRANAIVAAIDKAFASAIAAYADA